MSPQIESRKGFAGESFAGRQLRELLKLFFPSGKAIVIQPAMHSTSSRLAKDLVRIVPIDPGVPGLRRRETPAGNPSEVFGRCPAPDCP